MNTRNPISTARVAGHPLHPMLIPFPIAFFIATLVCDVVFWLARNGGWAAAGTWLLGAGLVTAALAAIAGFMDFFGDRRIRQIGAARHHMIGNVVAVLLQVVNFYVRYRDGADAILPAGLVLSLIVVGILSFTGWKGWDMVYRYRVGVQDEPRA